MPAPIPADRGFSLLELMIVLVFVAVGILALAGLQTHSFTDVHASGRRTGALDLAEMRAEVARGAGYVGAVSDSGVSNSVKWNTQVDSVDFGLRRVTVTVTWAESGGLRTMQLVNLLSAR